MHHPLSGVRKLSKNGTAFVMKISISWFLLQHVEKNKRMYTLNYYSVDGEKSRWRNECKALKVS